MTDATRDAIIDADGTWHFPGEITGGYTFYRAHEPQRVGPDAPSWADGMAGTTLFVGSRPYFIDHVTRGQRDGEIVMHGTTPDPDGNPYPTTITITLRTDQEQP